MIEIMKKMAAHKSHVLATRIDEKKAKLIKKTFPKAVYHAASRALTLASGPIEQRGRGSILVVSAGTSDIPVAEEAIVTRGSWATVTICMTSGWRASTA